MQADHAASHAGRCDGLVTLVRALPHHAQRSRVLLPIDQMLKVKAFLLKMLLSKFKL